MIWELLISYFVVNLTIMVYVFSYKRCINKKIEIKPYKIVVTMILTAIVMFNNLYNSEISKTIICYLSIMVACKVWMNRPLKETIYYSVVLSIISLMIELISSRIMAIGFAGYLQINKDFVAKTALTIVMGTLLYFTIAINIIRQLIVKLEEFVRKNFRYDVVFILLLILSNIILTHYNLNYGNNLLYVLSVIVVLIVAILLYFLLLSNFNKEKLEIKNKYLSESVKNYEIIADDYSELKHNLNADFMAIRSVANEKAKKVIDEKFKKYNKSYDWTVHVGKIPKGIQGIIYIKLYEIKNQKINVEINSEISKNITEKITAKNYALLCDILDVTLNNAIEAAANSKEKALYINMMENNQNLNIQILNTFENVIDLEKIGHRHYSTKQRKSGIGLNYINKINNREIKIKKEIINDVFIISISLPIK